MSSINKGLLGLFIVQAALLLGMGLSGSGSRLALSESIELLADLEPEKVSSVVIYGPSEDGDSQESIELARKGDDWVIAGADGYPAKSGDVKRLLSSVAGLRSRNKVLSGSTYHEKLEVAPDAYRRKLELKTDGETVTLFLGTSPSFKSVHVRRDGADEVYQVEGISESDAGARAWSWVDRDYHSVPKEEVWSVRLKNEKGEIQLDRDPASNTWAVIGVSEDLDTTAVDALVNDAREIGLEAPVGRAEKSEYALGSGASITLVTGTSTIAGTPPPSTNEVTVQVGAKLEGSDRRYLKVSTSDYVVEAAGYEVKKLVETNKADLVKEKDEDEKEGSTDAAGSDGETSAKTSEKPGIEVEEAAGKRKAPAPKPASAPKNTVQGGPGAEGKTPESRSEEDGAAPEPAASPTAPKPEAAGEASPTKPTPSEPAPEPSGAPTAPKPEATPTKAPPPEAGSK